MPVRTKGCKVLMGVDHALGYHCHALTHRHIVPWWRHQMETFSVLLAICAGNSSVTGEFPSQRSMTRSFDVPFDLRLNKQLSKNWWGWWFATPSGLLWRHSNVFVWCWRNILTFAHIARDDRGSVHKGLVRKKSAEISSLSLLHAVT